MKKLLIGLLILGLFSFTAIEAGVTIVRQVNPKQTIVQDFRAMYGLEKDMADFIRSKVKQGYVVKSVSMMDDETWSKGIVVMEKY